MRKYKRLAYEDRRMLEEMCKKGCTIQQMANKLGVHRDTLYKEFSRSGMKKTEYDADLAQQKL